MDLARAVRDSDRSPATGGKSSPWLLQRASLILRSPAKRAFDLLTATVGLILLSPTFLLICVVLALESRRSVFVRETRLGYDNARVRLLKFRTTASRDENPQAEQTTVGCLLRRTNLDELPQLFNVLRGDMSIVGPRSWPIARPGQTAPVISRDLPGRRLKPGIFSWAQVNGYDGDAAPIEIWEKRFEYDLYYINNWSFVFDLKILFRAVLIRQD